MTLLSCRQYTQIISNDDVTVHTYLWCCQVCCGRRPSLCATRRRKRSEARRATSTRSPSSSTRSTARTDRSATRTSPPKVCTQHAPHRQRSVRAMHLSAIGLYQPVPHRQRFVRALWLLVHQRQWSVRARYCWQSTASVVRSDQRTIFCSI